MPTSRWTTDSFTTDYINPGTSLIISRALSGPFVNIGKIIVTPSVIKGASVVGLYKRASCLDADMCYLSGYFVSGLVDPIQKSGVLQNARNEAFIAYYEDLDAPSGNLHLKITNCAGSVNRRYDVTIEYEKSAGTGSGGGGGSADAGAPGAVQNFVVTTRDIVFVCDWTDPILYVATLDNFALQYSFNSDFSNPAETSTLLLGKVNHYEGTIGNRTYYFRIAAHNQSGDTTVNTDADLTALYPDGWGPWTNFGSPTAVYASGTTDTNNPSGATGLVILTNSDDP